MLTKTIVVASLFLIAGFSAAHAADGGPMPTHDSMSKQDSMSKHDSMKTHGSMLKQDLMSKHDGMSKDAMSKEKTAN